MVRLVVRQHSVPRLRYCKFSTQVTIRRIQRIQAITIVCMSVEGVLQVGCSRIEERISQQNVTANESPPQKSV
jgi:hypothetical protein